MKRVSIFLAAFFAVASAFGGVALTFSSAPQTDEDPLAFQKHASVSLWNLEHSGISGSVGGYAVIVGGSFTRPADTTAYASGDLVANSVTAGSVVPISVAAARINAGSGMIRRVRLTTSSTSTTNASFRVHFYKTSPTCTNGDNGAWLTTESTYLGACDVTIDKVFSNGAKGIGVPLVGTEINFDAGPATQNIFALLEARGVYTPTSAETFTLAAEVLQN